MGKVYSSSTARKTAETIDSKLKRRGEIASDSNSILGFNYVSTDFCVVPNPEDAKQVDLVFYPYHLRLDLLDIGESILPVPTIETPSFSTELLSPILTKFPATVISSNGGYGISFDLKKKINLLDPFSERQAEKNGDRRLSPHNRVKCSDSYILPSSLLWTFT